MLEADLLNRLTIRSDDLWNLNEEELDQFETLCRKLIVNPQERKLSVAVDDEGSDGKPERMPRRIEMLSILSRIRSQSHWLAGARTLSLLLWTQGRQGRCRGRCSDRLGVASQR